MTEKQKFFAPATPALPTICPRCEHSQWKRNGELLEFRCVKVDRCIASLSAPPPDWCPLRGAR